MSDEKPQPNIETDTPPKVSKNLPISEAFIIAVISASAYLFAFLYERSFVSYFGIPTQFVSVNLVTLLTFGAATVFFLILSAGLANMLFSLIPKHPFLAFHIPRYALIGFLTVLVPLFLYEGSRRWLIIFCIWLVLTTGFFMLPLIKYRKEGNWAKRYDAAIAAYSGEDIQGLYSLVEKRYGIRDLGLIVFVIMACLALAGAMGEAEAINQKQFLVLNTNPELVVLRASGDNIICAPFDRNKQEVKKSFSIRKVADDPKLIMNLESIGPLKPVDKLSSEAAVQVPTPTPATEVTPNDNSNKRPQ